MSVFFEDFMDKNQYDLLYGIHPIVEALKAKRRKIVTIYTTKPTPKAWGSIERLLPPYVSVHYVSREALAKMAGTTEHQGVVAQAMPFVFQKKFFDPAKSPLLILLDGIQDVRNVGAIIRSAFCAQFDGIIICQKQGAPFNATVFKASAGLAEYMPVYVASSAGAAASELKKAGYNLYLALFDGEDAATVDYQIPSCLVIGSEGSGINPSLFNAGKHITIAQRTHDVSYNASVAAGILMFLMATKTGQLKQLSSK